METARRRIYEVSMSGAAAHDHHTHEIIIMDSRIFLKPLFVINKWCTAIHIIQSRFEGAPLPVGIGIN